MQHRFSMRPKSNALFLAEMRGHSPSATSHSTGLWAGAVWCRSVGATTSMAGASTKTEDVPDFLLPVREQAAALAKFPLRICNRFWSPSMEPAPPLAGTVIARSSATSSGLTAFEVYLSRLQHKPGSPIAARGPHRGAPLCLFAALSRPGVNGSVVLPAPSTLRYSITFRNVLDRG